MSVMRNKEGRPGRRRRKERGVAVGTKEKDCLNNSQFEDGPFSKVEQGFLSCEVPLRLSNVNNANVCFATLKERKKIMEKEFQAKSSAQLHPQGDLAYDERTDGQGGTPSRSSARARLSPKGA